MTAFKLGLIGFYGRKSSIAQAELAEATGLSAAHIRELESPNKVYSPSMKALFAIAKALSIKASKLIDIDDD